MPTNVGRRSGRWAQHCCNRCAMPPLLLRTRRRSAPVPRRGHTPSPSFPTHHPQSWSTIAAPGVLPNRHRAEGMLGNVTWDGSTRHDGDTADVHKILGNAGDFSERLKIAVAQKSSQDGYTLDVL